MSRARARRRSTGYELSVRVVQGTLAGPVIGTVVYFALREGFAAWAGVSGSWYLVAMGLVAIAVMRFAPRGLWGWVRERRGRRGDRA